MDAFVGIAAGYRGLWTCGTYPSNAPHLHLRRPGPVREEPLPHRHLRQARGHRIYSLKSNSDEIACATGVCTVDGVHSSQLTNETASYTLSESHFGLVRNTATRQADLIQTPAWKGTPTLEHNSGNQISGDGGTCHRQGASLPRGWSRMRTSP